MTEIDTYASGLLEMSKRFFERGKAASANGGKEPCLTAALLMDRGALCESQRALAEVLIRRGRVDEAERLALEAVETVSEHDLSSVATTKMSLGLVRAAQGRDEEAQALLEDALAEATGRFRGIEVWVLSRLEEFLRSRGREEEADGYALRLAALAPVSALGRAFADRMERIA